MVKVSVIVPIYKGIKYIPGIISQIEENATHLTGDAVELVLSNDDPENEINGNLSSKIIEIKVLNTNKNRGIHGARVEGLSHSKGEYILFLDQDDEIAPFYLSSQLNSIGRCDAVVCNIISGGMIQYNTDKPLYKAVSKECMIGEGNMISSPGQVLLRKSAIPGLWKEFLLKNNGADDWFLWLCMHSSGKKFALNEDVLFTRRVHYYNTSSDSIKMAASEEELTDLIRKLHILNRSEFDMFMKLIPRLRQMRVKENESWKKRFLILNDWLSIKQSGRSIERYLDKENICDVAIYGYGYLGKQLLSELSGGHVSIRYLIDKNAKFIKAGICVYTPDEELAGVDAVIVTLLYEDGLKQALLEKINMRLIWLEDIIFELANDDTCEVR